MILFLDDNKERVKAFKKYAPRGKLVVVKTSKECIEVLKRGEEWNIVFLDHDLGKQFSPSDEKSGMEVVKWIIKNQPFIKQIIIHSHNKPAADNMLGTLKAAEYHAAYVPFCILIERLKKASSNG